MLLQRPISKTSTLRAAVLVGSPISLAQGKVGNCTPIKHLFVGKAWYGMKDARFGIRRDPSLSSNFIHFSEPQLPSQLNQDPSTLHQETGARLCPPTHIHWVALNEKLFMIELCKLRVLARWELFSQLPSALDYSRRFYQV